MRRRDFLKSTAFLAAAPTTLPSLWSTRPATAATGKSERFEFAWLKGYARALAATPYQPRYPTLPKALADLDYDQYQAIRFRPDRALWAREHLDFRAGFFHRGPMFKEPVRMYKVIHGQAHEIAYDRAHSQRLASRNFSWHFAVDFAGGQLAALPKNTKVEPVISASRGQIEIASARPQLEINGYRAMFDLKPTDDSTEPIDLRLYLRVNNQSLTETWIYQWTPPGAGGAKVLETGIVE